MLVLTERPKSRQVQRQPRGTPPTSGTWTRGAVADDLLTVLKLASESRRYPGGSKRSMARHPEWFERLDPIIEVVRQSHGLEWLGRQEVKAVFCCSERDSIRLLHKFGAEEKNNSLSLPRSSLLAQLEAIRVGSTYAAFLRQRQDVAKHLSAARAETAARQFRVRPAVQERRARLEDLPPTITWRRASMVGPGRFEVVYDDGADLMWQLAEFLGAAGVNREEFFAGTEPSDDPPR
jgi:hypothetical protein